MLCITPETESSRHLYVLSSIPSDKRPYLCAYIFIKEENNLIYVNEDGSVQQEILDDYTPLKTGIEPSAANHLWLQESHLVAWILSKGGRAFKPLDHGASVIRRQHKAGFGFYQTSSGKNTYLEDTVSWLFCEDHEVATAQAMKPGPVRMGWNLWSALLSLDASLDEDASQQHRAYLSHMGTVISTLLYDGAGNFVCGQLGDTGLFVIVYNTEQQLAGVIRLNQIIHLAHDPKENTRIQKAGGIVAYGRVGGALAPSRAIGDHIITGVCAEAHIEHIRIEQIASQLGIETANIGKLSVMACSDGYTAPVDGYRTREAFEAAFKDYFKSKHEQYLLGHLQELEKQGISSFNMTESDLAAFLVNKALAEGSCDDITISVQTMTKGMMSNPFMMSVQDGHGGLPVARLVANKLPEEILRFSSLSDEDYAKHPMSIFAKQAGWERDHPSWKETGHGHDASTPMSIPLTMSSSSASAAPPVTFTAAHSSASSSTASASICTSSSFFQAPTSRDESTQEHCSLSSDLSSAGGQEF